jgi:hypothetical protein
MSTTSSSFSRVALIGATCFLIGVAATAAFSMYHAAQLREEIEDAQTAIEELRTASQTSHKTQVADVNRLRKLLQRLEEENAALRTSGTESTNNDDVATEPAAPTIKVSTATATPKPDHGGDRQSFMDRLKKEDPARYKQMQDEREQWRKKAAEQVQQTLKRLDDRMQAAQTQPEADLLAQLAATTARMAEIRQNWDQLRTLPEDQRQEQAAALATESRQLYQKLTELRTQDRQLQLQQLATQVGYQDANQSAQFVESVNRIITETSSHNIPGIGHGGGPDHGGGPGGR